MCSDVQLEKLGSGGPLQFGARSWEKKKRLDAASGCGMTGFADVRKPVPPNKLWPCSMATAYFFRFLVLNPIVLQPRRVHEFRWWWTRFVTTQNAYLHKDGETVAVKVGHETKLRVPVHTISGIVCFGVVSCSPFLMAFCAERDVGIIFLSENGRFLARVQGPVSGNVLLRREQYRKADDAETSIVVSKGVLTGKIANSRTVLQRALRDHGDKIDAKAVEHTVMRLSNTLERMQNETTLDAVRGYEGDAARLYFSVFDHLIVAQKKDFLFHQRSRRPPLDNVNALLSFLYTLLMHDVRSALEAVGLDPAVGFLHRDRPGRPSLALDIMEEFRPFLADRLALSLINLKQVQGNGFKKNEGGGVIMDDDTRKQLLVAYQARKQDEILHPFIDEKITIGLLPHVQALLMARYLRGDLDGYPPFVWR